MIVVHMGSCKDCSAGTAASRACLTIIPRRRHILPQGPCSFLCYHIGCCHSADLVWDGNEARVLVDQPWDEMHATNVSDCH